jgi:F-type H+-transporting ATPase subunit b
MRLYSNSRRDFAAIVILGVLILPSVCQTSRLHAQEAPTSSSAKAPGGETQPASEEASGKEAKEAGETEAVRHSPPVQWIARKTGLSLDQAYWLCVFVNFAIVFVSVGTVMRKKLPGAFKNRTEAIQKQIEEARKASEEARQRLAEVERRLSRLDMEINQMRREAEENAQAEEKRVLAAVQEERRRIVASTEQEIAMAANAARRDLKTYAAELAVDLAGKKIQVAKDTDVTLVREFTAQLGKGGR